MTDKPEPFLKINREVSYGDIIRVLIIIIIAADHFSLGKLQDNQAQLNSNQKIFASNLNEVAKCCSETAIEVAKFKVTLDTFKPKL